MIVETMYKGIEGEITMHMPWPNIMNGTVTFFVNVDQITLLFALQQKYIF